MEDIYIGKKVYRIVGWDDYPRQPMPYHVISSNYDGGDWKDEKGFETEEAAIDFIELKRG